MLRSKVIVVLRIISPNRIKRNSWVSMNPNGPTPILSAQHDVQNVFKILWAKPSFWKEVKASLDKTRIWIAFVTRRTNTPVATTWTVNINSRTNGCKVEINLIKQIEQVMTTLAPTQYATATTELNIWFACRIITWWQR